MKKIGPILKPLITLPWLPVWLVPVVLFSPLIFTGRPMYWGAVFLQFTPWRVEAFNQILAGHLPLWNSLNGMGAPLAANYQSALFYPPTWLLLPFYILGGAGGLAMGETWSVVIHLIWSGIGMVLLMRQLGCGRFSQTIAALAFSLSGYLVTRATFLSINATVAWLPWVILAAERLTGDKKPGIKTTLISSLVIGMLLLAGHAQTAFYTLLLAACWVLFRQSRFGWKSTVRVAFTWGLSVLLGCGLAAIQLLPTAEYLLQSQRAAEIGYDYAVNYSFLPWRFLTLLMANLFGTPADGTYLLKADAYWEDAIYIGLLPLCLAIAALIMAFVKRKSKESSPNKGLTFFLAGAAVIASLIALGSYTPIFPFLYRYIPTFDLFQAPARWMIWPVFALSLMAGFGAEAWRKPGKWGRFWTNLSLALGVTVTAIAILAGILVPTLPIVFIKAFIILGASIVLGCILVKTNPLPSTENGKRVVIWQWAVVAFVSVDLLVANWGFHQGADPSLYEKATAAAKEVKTRAGGGRLYISSEDLNRLQYDEFFDFRDFRMDDKWDALAAAVLPNTNLYGGLASVNNFDPLVPVRYSKLMAVLEKVNGTTHLNLLRRFGVNLIEVPDGELRGVRLIPLSGANRVRWVDCFIASDNESEALDIFVDQTKLYPKPVPAVLRDDRIIGSTECSGTSAEILVIEDKPGMLTIHVNSTSPGMVVTSDLHYPGWYRFDNQSDELPQVDYLFRGVHVEAGESEVHMVYIPWSILIGCLLTLLSLIITITQFVSEQKKERRANPSLNP
jgi:hypothetical protein